MGEKIKVLTFHSPAYQTLSDITVGNRMAYCAKHGYELSLGSHESSDLRKVQGERVQIMLDAVASTEWLLFMGVDTIFTNFTVRIEDVLGANPGFDMVVAGNRRGINNDVVLLRNCRSIIGYLELVRDTWRSFPNEQSAMERHMSSINAAIVKYRVMNSMPCWLYKVGLGREDVEAEWQEGDFIFHAAGMTVDEKAGVLREVSTRVVDGGRSQSIFKIEPI